MAYSLEGERKRGVEKGGAREGGKNKNSIKTFHIIQRLRGEETVRIASQNHGALFSRNEHNKDVTHDLVF